MQIAFPVMRMLLKNSGSFNGAPACATTEEPRAWSFSELLIQFAGITGFPASRDDSLSSEKKPEAVLLPAFEFYGGPGEIRTPDQLVRSQLLYPTELRIHLIET
jgi:hypothetical protein